jgi:transposase
MEQHQVFRAALGLTRPWEVVAVVFDEQGADGRGHLLLRLDFPAGSRFACPKCAKSCVVHDARVRRWRHLDFFQHETLLEARAPRTKCEEHGVLQVAVPWGRERGGFTQLMAAHILMMAREMPVRALARALHVHDTRLWRLIHAMVAEARRSVDMSRVKTLVVDETSRAKGHQFMTLFVEPGEEEARVLYATQGRDHTTFARFSKDLKGHGGDPLRVKDVCMDMSEAFRKGAEETLPKAEITYDRFHVVKLAGEGVDAVRRAEQAATGALTGTMYVWRKNPQNLTAAQAGKLFGLSELNLATMKAYHMRLNLAKAWAAGSAAAARRVLGAWRKWVHGASRPSKDGQPNLLEPMARVARTIKEHLRGVLNYFRKRLTSGVIEGFNSYVQAARARARGYRNPETFKTMIYLIGGRLKFALPGLGQ